MTEGGVKEGDKSTTDRLPNRAQMTRLVSGVEASWSAFLGKDTFLFDPANARNDGFYRTVDNPSVISLLVKYEYGGNIKREEVVQDWGER